jgi:shikimate dehydrogenase
MQLFGLIGFPLSHSFSQKYFTEKFVSLGLSKEIAYENFSIHDIEELAHLLLEKKFLCGFNVTIPYKKQIIPFLHFQTPEVKAMGACNCVQIQNKRLYGHNTDIVGFEQSLKPFLKPHHTHALVLGTGGAAAAVEYVLQKVGIQFKNVSRTPALNSIGYADVNETIMSKYQLIINTSPVGQFPGVEECPAIPYHLITPNHHLFDLIYNPITTMFLQKGQQHGATIQNGYEMLVLQAEESWRIWNA